MRTVCFFFIFIDRFHPKPFVIAHVESPSYGRATDVDRIISVTHARRRRIPYNILLSLYYYILYRKRIIIIIRGRGKRDRETRRETDTAGVEKLMPISPSRCTASIYIVRTSIIQKYEGTCGVSRAWASYFFSNPFAVENVRAGVLRRTARGRRCTLRTI